MSQALSVARMLTLTVWFVMRHAEGQDYMPVCPAACSSHTWHVAHACATLHFLLLGILSCPYA